MSIRLFNLLQFLLKYSVVFGVLVMTIHIGVLLLGYNEPWSELLFGYSLFGYATIMLASYVLKLCNLFRACATYNFIVQQCIILQREELFGEYINVARLVMFSIGIVLLTYVLVTNYCDCHE